MENNLLYSSVKVGPYQLSHRVVLAPLTRLRSEQPGDSPSDMMAEYYGQRSSEGGFLIAEGTAVSIEGRGYLGAPGIYTEEQAAGWKKVTDAVHAKGGRIFVQLFHAGRQSHVFMTGGTAPMTPSVVSTFEGVAVTNEGFVPTSPHRAIGLEEIAGVVEAFRHSSKLAMQAGFDGVELHGANGYLPDQFLQDGTNHRTDAYGGTIENRARFMLELVDAMVSVWGADRVGVRVSPSGEWGDISDSNPEATFGYLARRLDTYGLAYLHVIEPRIKGDSDLVEGAAPVASATLRKFFRGTIIAAGGFNREGAQTIVERGDADLVAFGRHFASNPDLPKRLKYNYPLAHYNRDAFWGGDHRGY